MDADRKRLTRSQSTPTYGRSMKSFTSARGRRRWPGLWGVKTAPARQQTVRGRDRAGRISDESLQGARGARRSVLLGPLFVAVLGVGDEFLAFRIDDEVEVFQRNLAEQIGDVV